MKDHYIYGIAYGCPKLKRETDCPLKQIENKSFEEKMEWINSQDNKALQTILIHHLNCTARKTNKQELN